MPKRSRKFSKQNKGARKYDMYDAHQKALMFEPPPILIIPKEEKVKEKGKTSKKERDSDFKEIELMVDPAVKPLGTIKRKVRILRNPTAEEWIKWLIELEEVCESKPIPDARRKVVTMPQFLADQAKDIWQKHYTAVVASTGLKYPVPENETAANRTIRENTKNKEILENTITACTREFCRVEDPARVQVEYLQSLQTMYGLSIRPFANRLKQINDYLPYFPPYVLDRMEVQKLRDSELISIIIHAKPISMSIDISKANVNVRKMNFEEFVNYLERLELVDQVQKQVHQPTDGAGTNTKRKRTEEQGKNTTRSFNTNKSRKTCPICKKPGHDSDKCWFNKEKGNKPPARTSSAKLQVTTERAYTLAEIKELFDNLPSHQANVISPHKKRKVMYVNESSESSDGEEVTNHVHVSDYFRKHRGSQRGKELET